MRRSLWHRALAALMAGWLAIVMAEPAVLHACPMHGGSHAAVQGGQGSAMAMHGVAGHSSDAPPPARGHQCTCLGQCCAPVGVAAPAALVALGPAMERVAARDAGLPDFEYVPVAAAHVLPFPNGPPSSVA